MPNSEADIERQVIGCWNFSSKRGWKVRHIFIDLGGNGSLMERANFQEMIKEGIIRKRPVMIPGKTPAAKSAGMEVPVMTP